MHPASEGEHGPDLTALAQQAQLVFVGTVEPPPDGDAGTTYVRVVAALRAPDVLSRLGGQTVRLASEDPPAVGSTWAFFVDGVSLGEDVSARELGRADPSDVDPGLTSTPGATPTGSDVPAEAVVVGRVLSVEKADVTGPVTEHDPDWWVATVAVDRVEGGQVESPEIRVLYANSRDTTWAGSPKLAPDQETTLALRSPDPELATAAPYQLTDRSA